MNPHHPGLAIGAGLLAFHAGLMRGRAIHYAKVGAEQERSRQAAQKRRLSRLESDVRSARADANAARADALMSDFLRRI